MPVDASWISRADAAALAGVHRNTVIGWEDRGLVKTKRGPGPRGQRVLIRATDVERLVQDRPVSRADRLAEVEAENAVLRRQVEDLTRERDEAKAERAELLREILDIARAQPRRR